MIKPNILFLLIDSLRADKCYGKNRTCLTPNLDNMIKNGVYFTQAISSSDATVLSLRGIFTGLIPRKTGSIKNKRINSDIKKEIPTIISMLKESGYKTIGKIPSFTFLDSLYSEFDIVSKFSVDGQWPRLEDGVGLEIIEQLKTNMQEPWFYYIHILDVHSKVKPKMPPLVISEKFDDEHFGKSKYERAVSATDYWLGEILKNINFENTIIIITADHGSFIPYYQNGVKISLEESITTMLPNIKTPKFLNSLKRKAYTIIKNNEEKNILNKIQKLSLTEYEKRNLLCLYNKKPFRVLYDELVRVPLLIIGKNFPKNKIIHQQVSTLDIFPTIMDTLQFRKNISTDGHSLNNLIGDKSIDEEPIFLQSSFPMEKESGYLVGIRTSKYKYNRSVDNPKQNVFLYDLQNDLKEENNIAEIQLNVVDEFEKILKKYLTKVENEKEQLNESESKIIEDELKKLGYI